MNEQEFRQGRARASCDRPLIFFKDRSTTAPLLQPVTVRTRQPFAAFVLIAAVAAASHSIAAACWRSTGPGSRGWPPSLIAPAAAAVSIDYLPFEFFNGPAATKAAEPTVSSNPFDI